MTDRESEEPQVARHGVSEAEVYDVPTSSLVPSRIVQVEKGYG